MKQNQLSVRYAKALYELSKEEKNQSLVFSELKSLEKEVFSKEEFMKFMHSPMVRPKDKEEALLQSLSKSSVSNVVKTFCLLLAKKNRISIFPQIVSAFEALSDEEAGVVRGVVRAPQVLGGAEQKAISDKVQAVTQKKPELKFEVDAELIGGLKAQVGSYTFDDSLSGHLRRMKEQLNRSTN
jgi:F-type H+-transporting ATPase subunit delta